MPDYLTACALAWVLPKDHTAHAQRRAPSRPVQVAGFNRLEMARTRYYPLFG